MKKILVVDDHHLVGEGTRAMLEGEKDFCIHVASNAMEVLEVEKDYDIYIIDIQMPEISGIELSVKLLQVNKERKIILYTGLTNQEHLSLFTEIGISGVISKTATKSELIFLINAVLSGYTIVPLSIFKNQNVQRDSIHTIRLTKKELEILKHVSKGLSNKEIAKKMFLTDRSIEYHLSKIYKKLGVKTRGEAMMEGVRLKLIDH